MIIANFRQEDEGEWHWSLQSEGGTQTGILNKYQATEFTPKHKKPYTVIFSAGEKKVKVENIGTADCVVGLWYIYKDGKKLLGALVSYG